MNKLRELIEKRKRAAEISDAAWKAEQKVFYSYIRDKEERIADLIDAASKLPAGCDNQSYMTTVADPLLRDIRMALDRLEDK